jgi:hypothetical protein
VQGDLNSESNVRKHNLDIKYKPFICILSLSAKNEREVARGKENRRQDQRLASLISIQTPLSMIILQSLV